MDHVGCVLHGVCCDRYMDVGMRAATYAIRFDFPKGPVYAGMDKGAAGWAPTLATALLFDDADKAQTFLTHAYSASAKWGKVVTVVSL